MPRIIILFRSSATASANVAGIPAAARVLREVALALEQLTDCYCAVLATPDALMTDDWCIDEIGRLAPGLKWNAAMTSSLASAPGDLCLIGELLPTPNTILSCLAQVDARPKGFMVPLEIEEIMRFYIDNSPSDINRILDGSSKTIVETTRKSTDGIVSTYLNRPISTRITRALLRFRSIRPIHATLVSAIIVLPMFYLLTCGRELGIFLGALLYQAASIIDGVDGEIARATFRTSTRGATLDSLTDAMTNLTFLSGLGIGLSLQGADYAAISSIVGFICLCAGLILLGLHAVLSGKSINFDALKYKVRHKFPKFGSIIVWITMRDFFALFGTFMVAIGLGQIFLQLFAFSSVLWLLSVLAFVVIDASNVRVLMNRELRKAVVRSTSAPSRS